MNKFGIGLRNRDGLVSVILDDGAQAILSDKTKMSTAALVDQCWAICEQNLDDDEYMEIFHCLTELRERHVCRPNLP